MSAPAFWAWGRDGQMHAWPLTEEQVQQAKAKGTEHDTVCGRTKAIGSRPVVPRHADAESNHCPDCWAVLHPRQTGVFLDSLVLPAIPRGGSHWRR